MPWPVDESHGSTVSTRPPVARTTGTVPVVRATGGLVDTVEPWDSSTGQGTGFRFAHADGTGMMWAVDEALAAWQDREAWTGLMKNGMSRDFSWTRSARQYVDLYRRAMAAV